MKRCFKVLGLIVAGLAASWVWYQTRPSVWLERNLDLHGSMQVQNSWIESSYLFHYTNAFCDVLCTENDFRNWQTRIRGVSVSPHQMPFPIQGLPPSVQEWWIGSSIRDQPMFQARTGGVTVVAVWYQERAFVDFGQRGKVGEAWDIEAGCLDGGMPR
jgi:hypothetical protein